MSSPFNTKDYDDDPVVPSIIRTDHPLHEPWALRRSERERYRQIARRSRERATLAAEGLLDALHAPNTPMLKPEELMPQDKPNGLRALSLFSGGGGLDLAFDRAGYHHVASYELLDHAAATLRRNRPAWDVRGGDEGDVTRVAWTHWRGEVDVLHAGPPCQPFSHAGRQRGELDPRDCWPATVRAIKDIRPQAFAAENVTALATAKFAEYVEQVITGPLRRARPKWYVRRLVVQAWQFGVPQVRRRVVFVGFQDPGAFDRFEPPEPTHWWHAEEEEGGLRRTMGVRAALGIPDDDEHADYLAPTIRSGLTGPRFTTSVCNSTSALRAWTQLGIWPNGVARDRLAASGFPVETGDFRLSVPDVALIQGFPDGWSWPAPVYQAIGQVGNAVPPPVGWAVARSVAAALAG